MITSTTRVRCRGDNRNRELRPIRHEHGDPVVTAYAVGAQSAADVVDMPIKASIAQRRAIRSQYRGRLRKASGMTLQQVIKRRKRDADFLL